MSTYVRIWMQLWITTASLIHQIGRVGGRLGAYMLTKVKCTNASECRMFSDIDITS